MAYKKYNLREIAELATVFGKSLQTIQRWIIQHDDRLTSEKAKSALQKIKK